MPTGTKRFSVVREARDGRHRRGELVERDAVLAVAEDDRVASLGKRHGLRHARDGIPHPVPDVEGRVLAEEEGRAVVNLDGEGVAALPVPENARPEIPAAVGRDFNLVLREALFQLRRIARLLGNRQPGAPRGRVADVARRHRVGHEAHRRLRFDGRLGLVQHGCGMRRSRAADNR